MFDDIARSLLKKRVAAGLGLDCGLLAEAWPLIVGEYFAEHTLPVRLSGERLVVAVSSSARLNEFTFLKEQLLSRINKMMPSPIAELHLVLARPDQIPQPRPRPQPPAPTLGEVPRGELDVLEDLEDEELKALLVRIRQISRGRGQR